MLFGLNILALFFPGASWITGIFGKLISDVLIIVMIGGIIFGGYEIWKHKVQADALNQEHIKQMQATIDQEKKQMDLLQQLNTERNARLTKAMTDLKQVNAKFNSLSQQVNRNSFQDRPASDVLKFTVKNLQSLEGVPTLRPTVTTPAAAAPAATAQPATTFRSTGNPSLDQWIKTHINGSN